VNKENSSGVPSDSVSGVGQTASMGKSTSVSSGAAKVFREFKWGLLTLFLLMVVVVGLVYDGGAKKKTALAPKPSDSALDINLDGPAQASPPAIPGAGDQLLGPVTGNDVLLNGGQPAGPVTDIGTPPPIPLAPTNPGYTHPTLPTNPVTTTTLYNDHNTGLLSAPPAPPVTTVPTSPVPPVVETSSAKTYKVQSGDTLSSIAQTLKLGKGGLKALIAANKTTLPDPNRLKVGMTLNVPAPAVTAVSPTTPVTPNGNKVAMADSTPKLDATTPPAAGDYTVQSGDTLERIARKVFDDGRRWQDIHNWNRDQLPDPARLRVGQVLKIKQSAKTSTNKPRVSEADLIPNEEKAAVVETPLPAPNVNVEKEVVAPVKESKKKIASAEKHDEPKVEVMSATSSAFAP